MKSFHASQDRAGGLFCPPRLLEADAADLEGFLTMTPKVIRLVCAGSLLLGLLALAEPCAAQTRRPSTPNNSAALSASKSNVDNAKKFLDEANKRLNDLRPKHQQAEADLKKEQREYQQAREAAKQQFEQDPQMVRAREKHAEAKKAADEQHQRVVAALKSQPAYKAAAKRLSDIKAVHDGAGAKDLSDEVRKSLAKDEAAAVAEIRRMEEEAVNKDSAAKPAHEREHEAGEELARLTKKREATIDGDSRVSSGKISFGRARDAEQLAHREFQAAQADATQAQRNLQSANNAYAAQQAQLAQQQRMNSSRNSRGSRSSRTQRRY